MIAGIRSKIPSFRSPLFEPGLNLIVAHRTSEAKRRDTRNGLGKTTLLEIIRFCLGEDKSKISILHAEELRSWVFELQFRHRGHLISLERAVKRPGTLQVSAPTNWFEKYIAPVAEDHAGNEKKLLDTPDESRRVQVEDWKSSLGSLWYGLQPHADAVFQVSTDDLISYEIRRDIFIDPFRCRSSQYKSSIHLCNAFMLDLNWELASQWQALAKRQDAIEKSQRSLQDNLERLPLASTSLGELEAERDRLQDQVGSAAEQLASFKVHPQYVELESEANALTSQIHDLNNDAIQLNRLIEFHERSITLDQPAADRRIIELYESAGTQLPTSTTRRLEEVQAFHVQITRNRRDYLREEHQRLERQLAETRRKVARLTSNRAALLTVIKTHGAIDEHAQLAQMHRDQKERLRSIEERIETLKLHDSQTGKIASERIQLQQQARRDLDERAFIKQARKIYNSNSRALYESPGNLIVDICRDQGFQFRVDIKRSGSAGISKMKVFCYDLMRAELWSKREIGPGFLIHDSTLFADVDERQVARALELGERKSRECGFQYIVCLNSDKIPYDEFSDSFDVDRYVRLTLTDDKPEGSLLGMRF